MTTFKALLIGALSFLSSLWLGLYFLHFVGEGHWTQLPILYTTCFFTFGGVMVFTVGVIHYFVEKLHQ